jgi:hypothetical protein
MNDELASSSSHHRRSNSDGSAGPSRWAENGELGSTIAGEEGNADSSVDGPPSPEELRQRKSRAQDRRLKCIDELLATLDAIIYVELITIYYLEYVHKFRFSNGLATANALP